MTWDAAFLSASSANRGKYALDAGGRIIENAGAGAFPAPIYGFPFPEVSAANDSAARRILWNRWYLCAKAAHASIPLTLVVSTNGSPNQPSGDGKLRYFIYYCDGGRHDEPPDNTLWRDVIAADEQRLLLWQRHRDRLLWLNQPPDFGGTPMPWALRSKLLSPAGLCGEDLFVWSGELRHFDWSDQVREIPIPVAVRRKQVRLQEGALWPDGERREWVTAPFVVGPDGSPQSEPPAGDPWATSAGTATPTHAIVSRTVFELEGSPRVDGYDFAKQILHVDKENFFLYSRTLIDDHDRVIRVLHADFATAWNREETVSIPFSTIHKAVNSDPRLTTYVYPGTTTGLCRFDSVNLEKDLFTRDRFARL